MTQPTRSNPPPAPSGGRASGEAGSDTVEKSPFRATLNLPRTTFPMKANLVQNEPASLRRWAAIPGGGLYRRVRETRAGRETFVFHDGPPYANGAIHLGHVMNKCLKDFVVRTRTMMGFDCPYVPGWDCHGLPIEHKVMSDLVAGGKFEKLRSLDESTRRVAIRRECQRHAESFVKLHIQQMSRLLTLADYEHPYLTMTPPYEGAVLEVLAQLLDAGLVYRALKPVHWSIANETALADAELEYADREDHSVYVDFESDDPSRVYRAFGLDPDAEDPDDEGDDGAPDGAVRGTPSAAPRAAPGQRPCFMIWTTTPWTLPANVAVAVNPAHEYALVRVDGNVTVLARELVERVTRAAGAVDVEILATAPGSALVGLRYRHPFLAPDGEGVRSESFRRSNPGVDVDGAFRVVPAEYVTLDDGTGLVHTAPGHGEEDYQTGLRERLPIYCPVRADGTYDASAPAWLQGLDVWKANALVTERLRDSGHLFFDHVFTHSYPHDWRSKTPTIFRCTEQWFVGVDRRASSGPLAGRSLREASLATTAEGSDVSFVPAWGRNRLRGMLEARPDWCISRQRSWGLPIPAFERADGTMFMTPASVRAVARAVRANGADLWFRGTPADLLRDYDPASDPDAGERPLRPDEIASLRKGGDILDVWFESGSSWNAVLRERSLGYPAELYLEGSDQHRGWFQLSLLPAVGVTGRPPFRTLLTHGFMVDKDGRKLSKSRGDSVDDLFQKYGADVVRWWVASLAYENDVKVDDEFFQLAGESYRKIRNTLRFLLANLDDHDGRDAPAGMPPPTSLDAWVLGAFERLREDVVGAYSRYAFRDAHARLYDFCNETLSATYLASVKDRLYCDRPDAPRRRRTQSTLWALADGLCRLLAPLLPHTADEAYRALRRVAGDDRPDLCVHLDEFPHAQAVEVSPAWVAAMRTRSEALAALERAKGALGVDNPLDAGVTLPDPDGLLGAFDPVDLADLLGVSRVTLSRTATEPGVQDLRSEARCERSWKRDGTVRARGSGPPPTGGMLCDRCAGALGLA